MTVEKKTGLDIGFSLSTLFLLLTFSVFSAQAEEIETYKHGRFVVEVTKEGQRIIGGQFVPNKLMPDIAAKPHVIFIDYSTKELAYYQKDSENNYQPIIGYAVVTAEAAALPKDIVRGIVTEIDTKPTWCPTQSARDKYPSLPAGCLPFGHKDNEMGVAKFIINWFEVKGFEAVRVHGTKGYPEGKFWEEGTLGCTRLNNDAINNLISLLGPKAVEQGIEIVLLKGSPLSVYVN